MVLQEHKLAAGELEAASAWCKAWGWHSLWSPARAEVGQHGGRAHSGGCAIMVRDHLGLAPGPEVPASCRHRWCSGLLSVPGFGEVLLGVPYLISGEGVGEGNLNLLQHVGSAVAGWRVPLLLLGDWQNSPEAIDATGFSERLGCQVVAPEVEGTGTYKKPQGGFSTIDFMVGTVDILRGLQSSRPAPGGTYNLHRPLRHTFHSGLHVLRTLSWVKAESFNRGVFAGPEGPALEERWAAAGLAIEAAKSTTGSLAERQSRIDEAYRLWAGAAEGDLEENTGTKLRARGRRGGRPQLVWQRLKRTRQTMPEQPVERTARVGHWLSDRADEAKWLFEQNKSLASITATLEHNLPDMVEGSEEAKDLAVRLLGALQDPGGGVHLAAVAAEAKEFKEHREKEDFRIQRATWKEWAIGSLEQGAGKAHRITKRFRRWQPTVVKKDGLLCGDPTALLHDEAAKWQEIWGGWVPTEEQLPCSRDGLNIVAVRALPALGPDRLAEVSGSFAESSASAMDGFHVTDIRNISAKGRLALSGFYEAVEANSMWPLALGYLPMPMLEKGGEAGGFRLIGIFPAVVRIYFRARAPELEEWEQSCLDAPCFAAQRGSAAEDVAWHLGVRGEALACRHRGQQEEEEQDIFVAGTWDLAKCYETIGHELALKAAELHQAPMVIVQLAILLYRSWRFIMLGQAMAMPRQTFTGIVAGCAAATRVLKSSYRALFLRLVTWYRDVGWSVYIDDFTASGEGSRAWVMSRYLQAVQDMLSSIKEEVGCRVAPTKGGITASCLAVARQLRACLPAGGAAAKAYKCLGVDIAAGRTRRQVRLLSSKAARAKVLNLRFKKFRMFARTVGAKAKKLVTTGWRPALVYGSSSWGMDDREMAQLSRVSFACSVANTSGRSRTAMLLLRGSPEASAAWASLHKWAKEVWQLGQGICRHGSSLPSLLKAFGEVRAFPPASWAEVRGPIGAAICEASRLGWQFDSATTIILHDGEVADLLVYSPAFLVVKAKEAYQLKKKAELGTKLGLPGPVGLEPVLRTLAATKDPHSRAIIECFLSGGLWPNNRLAEAGFAVQASCDKCGRQDSVRHRLWECRDERVAKLRAELVPSSTADWARQPGSPSIFENGWAVDYIVPHLQRHRGYHLRDKTKNKFF